VATKKEALIEERRVKRLNRRSIEKLISDNTNESQGMHCDYKKKIDIYSNLISS